MKYVTQDMVETYSIIGSPDDCIDTIQTYLKQGVDEVIIADPLGKDAVQTIELVGREIIPHLP